jgi:hypothetical protein
MDLSDNIYFVYFVLKVKADGKQRLDNFLEIL